MPTIVDCPACQRKLRVPDDLLGEKVRCPSCGDTFTATGQEVAPPPPPSQAETLAAPPSTGPPIPPIDGPSTPSETSSPVEDKVSTRETSPRPSRPRLEKDDRDLCPYCDKPNRPGAVHCRHCGEELDDEDERRWDRREVRRDSEPHRGGMILTLGIVSIACGVLSMLCCPFLSIIGLGIGIPSWVMGHRDLAKMRDGVMDRRGEGQTQGGWICGIVGTILCSLGVVVTVLFSILYGFMIFGAMSAPGGPAGAKPIRSGPGQGNPPGKMFFEREMSWPDAAPARRITEPRP